MEDLVTVSAVRPIHVIDYPENPYFVARDSLLELIDSRLKPQTSDLVFVRKTPAFTIWGGGGQGKTQTATQFVYTHLKEFHAILWITADTSEKLLEGLAEYALRLKLVERAGDSARDAGKLIDWFKTTAVPWLLIYDNAEDTMLINKHWPGQSRNGAILITSRDSAFATANVAGDGEELPPLDEEAAIKMLRQGVPPGSFDVEEAKQTVDIVGRVALGIQATIGLINDAGVSLRQFNQDFRNPRAFLHEIELKHVHRNFAPYEKTMAQIWRDELQILAENNVNALHLLDFMALLDPDSIQEQLLMDGLKLLLDKRAAPTQNLTTCMRALKRLVSTKRSRNQGETNTYYVHRFLQVSTQMMMTSVNRHEEAFARATTVLKELMTPHWVVDWAKWKFEFTQYVPHVQSVCRFYLDLLEDDENKKHRLRKIPVSFLEMIRKAGLIYYKRNFFRIGFDMLDTATTIIDEHLDEVFGDQQAILFEKVEVPFMQACIATEVGDFAKSLHNFQKAHDAFKEMKAAGYEKDFEHTLVGGLANSYSGNNRNIKAMELYRECIKLQKPADEFEHPYEINLCRAMWAHGKDEEAAEYLEEYIARRVRTFGEVDDTRDYLAGHALNVLGNVRIGQDRLDEAFELHKRALVCWNATYGVHHKTGDLNYKIAWHHAMRHQWNKALTFLEEAMIIYSDGCDKNFRDGEIARTKYKKGVVLCQLGRVEEGEKLMTEAEDLRRTILGADWFPAVGEVSYDCLISLWAR